MKIPVKRTVEIDVKYLRVLAPVRFGDEDIPLDFPFRKDDWWDVTIDLEAGRILDWPNLSARVDMKVTDGGSYFLLDENKTEVAKVVEDYVPHGIIPGSYGDYIEMTINEDGSIVEWPELLDFDSFFDRDE